MIDLQKEILLELYKNPGIMTNVKPLLLSLNPEKKLLVSAIKFLEINKLIVTDNLWRPYKLRVAGKENEIKDFEFNFELTLEGELLVRERYIQPKQQSVGFSGNVIGDNFQNNLIVLGNGNKTGNYEEKESSKNVTNKKKNRFLKFLKRYWWGLVVPVSVGLIVWALTN